MLALLIAGCGTDTGSTEAPQKPSASKARPIATLGDSIVAGTPLWDPDAEVRAALPAVDEDSQWQRWVDTTAPMRNCGVPGERTDQIGLRYRDCVTGARAVVVQGGINDIAGSRDVRNTALDLECMVDQAIADDLPVAMVEVLPWNNGDPTHAAAIRELNGMIHALADARGIPVLPFFATLEDPAMPGRMPAALTGDGDHPNLAGYRKLGEVAWREPKLGTPVRAHRDGDCLHLDLH